MTEAKVQEWFDNITLSLHWRKPYEEVWDRIIDYLKGKYFDKMSEDDKICVNMVRPHVNVVIPAIYSRNPDVIVLPRRRKEYLDDVIRKRAEVMQNLLRYLLKELDIKTEVKLCILDAVLTGHAWTKTGYETEFEGEEAIGNTETLISSVLKSVGINKVENDYEDFNYNEKVIKERAWALRVSPYDIIVPCLSRRPEELYWIGERIILPYDMVMDSKKYKSRDIKPSTNAAQLLAKLRGSNYETISYAKDKQYCILYELWDNVNREKFTICEGNLKALEEPEESIYTFLDSGCHPYVQLRFNEINDEFYPQGDIEPAEPQIKEFNETRTQMLKHRRRYNRKYLIRPGSLDEQAKADLSSGEDGTIIEPGASIDDNIGLDNIVHPIADASLPPEVYASEARVKDDLFTILGTSDYASKASGGARTATEASIMATQSRFRVEERIDLIETFVGRIIRNLAMICQRFMDAEQVGNVVGLDGVFWIQVQDRREIQGEFSYNVLYGSTAPINRETDREQFTRFYVIARDDPYFDQVKLRLQLVRKHDLENAEQWLVPQIAQELDKQRMVAIKQGLLLGMPQNALGTLGGSEQGGTPTEGGRLPTGQPRGLPGDVGGGPELPGGKGGTQLAGV